MKFKVGDRVEVLKDRQDEQLIGMIGRISKTSTTLSIIEVDFGTTIFQRHNRINDTTHAFWREELKLVPEVIDTSNLEIIINGNFIAITDRDGDIIEITKEQLKQVYEKVYK